MTTADLADQCAQAVMETVPLVMRAIREEMRRRGAPLLSIPQLRTLAYLYRCPGSCLFQLAEHLGVTRPTASVVVERLVRRGMVTRAANPQERRRVVLKLTPLGTRHFRRARQSTQTWMATALSRLSPARLRRIMQGVTLLGEPFESVSSGDGHQERMRPPGPIHKASHLDAPLAAGRGGRSRTVRSIDKGENANGH